VSWRLFDRDADRYDSWYATAQGLRASREETRLLAWLLDPCPQARTVLDVGSGTGHFIPWLAERGLRPIGLDRAPAMLACLRRRLPGCPLLLADAHALPLRDRAVDLVLFVTTIEFLDDPRRALVEAVRVARVGVLALALNRWSLGGLSRRVGPASRDAWLRHARDLSPHQARTLLARAAGSRLAGLRSRTTLLPAFMGRGPTRLPCGDVVGVAAMLEAAPPHARRPASGSARASAAWGPPGLGG
jgi:SAM-dependent methyltransferase